MSKVIDYSSNDGVKSKLTIYTASKTDKTPVILLFPAMGVEADYYQPFAQSLCNQGLHVITADLRGHGHFDLRPSNAVDFGYHEMIHFDYLKVFEIAKQTFPGSPRFLLGHSLGGQIGGLFLSLHPKLAQGLVLVASCNVYYKGWKGKGQYRILPFTQLTPIISRIVGHFPGKYLGFAGREARTVMKDWAYNARTGNYKLENNSNDFEKEMAALEIPILSLTIKKDWMAPRLAADYLCDKFKSSKVDRRDIGAEDAGLKKVSHFSWVKQPDYFAREIIDWISKQL